MKYAEEKNAIYESISAYSNRGIEELFENIAKKCLNIKENKDLTTSIKLSKKETFSIKKKKCC